MLSKKMSIILICLIAISGVIELSFRKSVVAQIIARSILLIFPVYLLLDKDFKTKYPNPAMGKPGILIILVVFLALTVYQFVCVN